MGRQEQYTLAMREVLKRRQRAETQALTRYEALFKEHPHLAELNRKHSATGAEAARLSAGGNTEESAKKLLEMRQVQKEYEGALALLGLTPNDLKPQWTCKVCCDTGRTHGRICECIHKNVRDMMRENVNEFGPLQRCRFDNFDVNRYPQHMDGLSVSPKELMRHNLENCRIYAQEFDLSSESLYLYGDAGLGKTHLALSIAHFVLERGHDVLYVSAQKAFARLDKERRSWTDTGYFNSLLKADLLVLDDLGTEYLDAYTRSLLYELLNTRMHRRPTVYTTNIGSQAQLQQRYTEKISSRLLGECHCLHFVGQDLRLQNRKKA